MLYLTHAWIKLCVHQPFYRHTPGTSRCVAWTGLAIRESDLAALRVLDLFNTYNRHHELHKAPACAVPIAFLAGVVFIYQAERLRGMREERAAASGRLGQIMRILSMMERTWQCARQPQAILEQYNSRLNNEEARYAPRSPSYLSQN